MGLKMRLGLIIIHYTFSPLETYIEYSIVAKWFHLLDVAEKLIRDKLDESLEHTRDNLFRHGKHLRVDDDKVEEHLFDVAAELLGLLTLLPVKVTNLNALLNDANYRLALSLDVLVKYFVIEFLKVVKYFLCNWKCNK